MSTRHEHSNSPQPEFCPCVVPDGSFISFLGDDGSWTEPRNLGRDINSSAKDEYPYITPDGKFLFFNSNRTSALDDKPIPDGPGNIYWVEAGVVEKLKPPVLIER